MRDLTRPLDAKTHISVVVCCRVLQCVAIQTGQENLWPSGRNEKNEIEKSEEK